MALQISELALAKLRLLLFQETEDQSLAFRIVPLTSGCSTPSFALELTEVGTQPLTSYQNVPFIDQTEHPWLDGLIIDLSRETGNFSIYHPNPSFLSDCGL